MARKVLRAHAVVVRSEPEKHPGEMEGIYQIRLWETWEEKGDSVVIVGAELSARVITVIGMRGGSPVVRYPGVFHCTSCPVKTNSNLSASDAMARR